MAEYIPNNYIYILQNIPWDDSYNNVMWFEDNIEQQGFFTNFIYKSYSNCSYHRIDSQIKGGRPRSSVRVPENAENLYTCNYLMFQNRSFGNKYFFAFIKEINYINPNVAEIIYELDHFQTWMMDIEIHPSLVLREHYINDSGIEPLFANIQPEQFNNLPVIETAMDTLYFDITLYLVVVSEDTDGTKFSGDYVGGIYQGFGIKYAVSETVEGVEWPVISDLLEEYKDRAEAVALILPVPFNRSYILDLENDCYQQTWPITGFLNNNTTFPYNVTNGYKPKNRKLLQYPYCYYKITSSSGDTLELKPQSFNYSNSPTLTLSQPLTFVYRTALSIPPEMVLVPLNYGGVFPSTSDYFSNMNYEYSVKLKDLPASSMNIDVFAQWMRENASSTAIQGIISALQITAGIALTSTGAGAPVGASLIASGVTSFANTLGTIGNASAQPNQISGNVNNGWFRTAFKSTGFEVKFYQIKEEDAQKIDEYFNLYGYATNRVKMPNLKGRKYWNYIQTEDICITGSIPVESMNIIKGLFNRGIRLWHENQIGNFDLDNEIISTTN